MIGRSWVLLAAALLAAGLAPARAGDRTVEINVRTPLETAVFVPNSDGGGEWVQLSGQLHGVFHLVIDEAGGVHGFGHDNFQGVAGVGTDSGARYRASDSVRFSFFTRLDALTMVTVVETARFSGPRGCVLFLHVVRHFTLAPDGSVATRVSQVFAAV